MDTIKKRELRAAYKERRKEMGVVSIACSKTGETFFSAATDVPAAFNRLRFQLGSGLCPDGRLQVLWNQQDENSFTFEVVQRLDPAETDADTAEELETLLSLCLSEHPEATRLKTSLGKSAK